MKKLLAVVFAVSCLPALAQDVDGLAAETKKTVLPVVPKVMRAMQEAVNDKGVAEAIPVCKEQAPKLIQEVREATGWSIRRVSLKTRNAERGAPDGWEKAVLAEFEQRAAAECRAG